MYFKCNYFTCKLLKLKKHTFIWVFCFVYSNSLFFVDRCCIYMEAQNFAQDSEFLLTGLSDDPDLQPLLFGLFLSMYLVAMFGNLLIILAVISDSHLHTPMYFFLFNLSLADIGFITTTVPKMLVNIQAHSKAITCANCLTQVSFFSFWGV